MKRILLLVLSFYASSLFAQNLIPDAISTNITLTKDKSPYTLSGTIINIGATLTIEPGVIVNFTPNATINVKGNLIVEGKENDTVYFSSKASDVSEKIKAIAGKIELHYVKANTDKMFIYGSGSSIVISHCSILSSADGNGEDCIGLHDYKKVIIEYCTLKGHDGSITQGEKNDAIDFDNCDSAIISHNNISYFADDAVDCGTQTKYAYINDNILSHCNYGASIGESSIAYVFNNISEYNDGGLEVHDSATVYCGNNVLFANTYGIDVFHREFAPDQTPGTVTVKNTIFSQNKSADIGLQAGSKITISNSLSDKDTLQGINNLLGDPMFVNPETGDFSLLTGSPAVNTGIDEDGNAVNMGIIAKSTPTNIISYQPGTCELNISPNPVLSQANITLRLNHVENIKISIISIEGRTIAQIYSGKLREGEYNFKWDAQRILKGLYIISMNTNRESIIKKIIVK
jgi:hypothetical protein